MYFSNKVLQKRLTITNMDEGSSIAENYPGRVGSFHSLWFASLSDTIGNSAAFPIGNPDGTASIE